MEAVDGRIGIGLVMIVLVGHCALLVTRSETSPTWYHEVPGI